MSLIYGDITIEFPIANVYDDTVQLLLNVVWSGGVDTQTYTSDELYLKIKTLGNISLQFDLDNPLITPADLRLEIYDLYNTLADYLFGVDFNLMTVTAEVKINGSSEFKGTLIEESLEFDESTKTMQLVFSSNSNKITEISLYSEDDTPLNPFNYSSLESYIASPNNGSETLKLFTGVMEDVLKLVDENIDINYIHDWQFIETGGAGQTIRSGSIEEIYIELKSLFNNASSGYRLLSEVLKNIARSLFAQIIIPKNTTAYFRKLYYYSTSNLQTVTVLKRVRTYKYSKIKYAKAGTLATPLHVPDENAYTEVAEDYIDARFNWSYTYLATGNTQLPFGSITKISDPNYTTTLLWYYLPALLFYNYRSKTYYNRVDRIRLKGLGYDYSKNFDYNGNKYQILSMDKFLAEGYTEVEALELSEITTLEQVQ